MIIRIDPRSAEPLFEQVVFAVKSAVARGAAKPGDKLPSVRELAPGVGEISVALDDPQWISVLGQPSAKSPGAMQDALADVERIGLVFGSSNARGHGVYATAPAKFTLTGFRVE